jgi:nucleoside-diphosphate-sugar epimerase
MQNVLITGGGGFIGTNLVLRLTKQDNINIIVIDNLWRGTKKYIENCPNVTFIEKDLTDYSVCLEHIKNVDIVYHLAEIVSGVDFAFNNQSFIYRQNIIINSNVISACVENNIKKYIYVGTACSYPKENQHKQGLNYFKEEDIHPLTPETSYGMSKYLGEYEAELIAKEHNIDIGILRLHNVYGPYCSYDDKTSQVIPSLIKKSLATEKYLEVWGSGNQYRDFIYVDDVVDALLLASEKGMNMGVIQIGTGSPTTIKKISEILVTLNQEKDIELKYNLNKPEGDFGRLAIIEKAKQILNWEPKTTIEQGLEKTFKFMHDEIHKI